MTAQLLDGKALARQIQAEIANRVAAFRARTGKAPCLAAVLAGDDPASAVYVRNKEQACKKAGIESRVTLLPSSVSAAELLDLVQQLNGDVSVHGILVQLPLPASIDATKILDAVHPLKDVDCFHPENVGLLVQGRPRYLPCTPAGIVELLVRGGVQIAGAHVVVVGRSDIVGKPMANLLLQKGRDATVTICHSRSRNLAEITRSADVLIVAAGKPKLVTAEMVRPGAVVVDVGMNRTAEGLVGDVDFAAVKDIASKITPVPGGVGPLTVTMLLANTLRAAEIQTAP